MEIELKNDISPKKFGLMASKKQSRKSGLCIFFEATHNKLAFLFVLQNHSLALLHFK
jgi:hypothetical protein